MLPATDSEPTQRAVRAPDAPKRARELAPEAPQRAGTAASGRAHHLLDTFVRWPAQVLLRKAAALCGASQAARSADRRLLEDTILRRYAGRAGVQCVLFVGTRRYTRVCERLLQGRRYLSMDIDPRAARYGSRQGHVTACASRAAQCFEPASFDVIVFNGVFGWGLDERAEVEAAVRGFHRLLREGGELVVGWNDVPARRPFTFGELQALRGFERFALEPGGPLLLEVPGPNRHRFEFFRKPASGDAAREPSGSGPHAVG